MNKILFIAVIIYFPDGDIIGRCIEYKKTYGFELVVWDNTPNGLKCKKEINRLIDEGIVVLGGVENVGLGESINELCEWAILHGYQWMLTLDQDSFLEKLDIARFETIDKDDLAWIGVRQQSKRLQLSGNYFSIQSGSIVSPHILSSVGGLKSDMFIDHLDHEICLRLQKNNYSVLCEDIVRIKHSVGERKEMLGLSYSVHNLNRFRYFVRNGFYCVKRYPEYSLYFIPQMLKEAVKQLLQGRGEIILVLITDALNGLRARLGVIK